jgi:hypothetical protein
MDKDPIKMPSARLPVTFLKDVDVLALYEKKAAGLVALWAWCGLLLVAKDTKNNGVFVGPPSRYCARLGMSAKQLESAMKLLNEVAVANGNKPWIVKRANGFALRNWAKWNRGAGHEMGPVAKDSLRNQKNLRTRPANFFIKLLQMGLSLSRTHVSCVGLMGSLRHTTTTIHSQPTCCGCADLATESSTP